MQQVLYKLPDGWSWRKLSELAKTTSGGTPSRSNKDYWGGSIPWVKSGELGDSRVEKNEEFITELGLKNSSAKLFPKESLLLALYGATAGKLGVLTYDAATNQAVCCINQDDQLLARDFLRYYLLSQRKKIIEDSFGGAQPNISQAYVREIDIPTPPLTEQKRIVEKLDALLTRIDTAIEHLQESVTLADALYASALDKEFSKLMKESDVLPFKKLVDNQDGRRIPIKAGERQNTHGTYPYYGATGVIDYVDDFIFEGERLLISEDGANLVARKYPIAFIADGKYWVNNHAHVVNALPELTSNLYLKKFFAWVDLSSYITGSAQPKLSQGKLNTIPVPVPPLSEQTEIVVELDKAYQLTESLKKEVDEKLGILASLKASILDSAFKGEL